MTVERWAPFSAFTSLEQEMHALLDRVGARPWIDGFGWKPDTDICRVGRTLIVEVELPGIDPAENLSVDVEDNVLAISGERMPTPIPERGRLITERRFGSFRREIMLPCDAGSDSITAVYDNGVLTVEVGLPPGVIGDDARRDREQIEVRARDESNREETFSRRSSGVITFGPVPSRRLGRSLGINNTPPKVCSYSCIYCQVGLTSDRVTAPRSLLPPEQIRQRVCKRVEAACAGGERIDYLTFVPDGEPTLDIELGESIRALRSLGIPIAVISNGSLLWQPAVRAGLANADWVSVKVDAVIEDVWRRVNHPDAHLNLEQILDGIRRFAGEFEGELCTETMLVGRVNDSPESLRGVARYLADLDVEISYLSIPTRPPALPGVRAPDERVLNQAYHLFERHLTRVEYLIGYEGDAFAATGDVAADVLSIAAVHPLRRSAIEEMLTDGTDTWDVIEELVANGHLKGVEYLGEVFYLRSYAEVTTPGWPANRDSSGSPSI